MIKARINGSAKSFGQAVTSVAKAMDLARARAANRAVEQARNEAVREIRTDTRIKAGYAKRKMQLVKANRTTPGARLRVRHEPLPIFEYAGTRLTKKGLSVQPVSSRGRLLIAGGSRQKLKTGHVGGWRRAAAKPATGQRWKDIRYPIKSVYGPPLVDRFQEHLPAIEDRALEILAVRYQHELDFILSRM